MSLTIATHNSPLQRFWSHRVSYTLVAAAIAFTAYLLLYMVGFVPNEFRYDPAGSSVKTPATAPLATTSLDQLSGIIPTNEAANRITIEKIGVDTVIKNPVTTNVQALNNYLAEGAVRWPTSGHPGNGNLYVFGHSTSYETVINQAYKTFNRIEELERGDVITVRSNSGIYRYSVADVQFYKDAEAYIPFNSGENMLTLSTCNSFGAKEDRIVVRANFEGYQPYVN
jgi:LPXTG-site transpeptidase (sortase) family protein